MITKTPTEHIHSIINPQHAENTAITSLRHQYIQRHRFPAFTVPTVDTTADILNAIIYNDSSDQSFLPMMQTSYHVFINHLVKQFKELRHHGYFFYASERPYQSSAEMLQEISNTQSLRHLPSDHTDSIHTDHLMMRPTSLVDSNGADMSANDVFRCVHDVIAHGAGYSFGLSGEKGAWLIHRQCLSSVAHLALWNETRGQNAWTNAGPHMRKPDGQGFYSLLTSADTEYVPAAHRPFPQQKSVLAPYHFL